MRIKIVKSLPFDNLLSYTNYHMPSLGMARIYTHLKSKGFDITQMDLLRTGIRASIVYPLIVRRIVGYLENEERFREYLRSAPASLKDKELVFFVRRSDVANVDVLLISVYTCPFSAVFGLMVAKFFKSLRPDGIVVLGGEWQQTSYVYERFGMYNALGILDYFIFDAGELPSEMLLGYLNDEPIERSEIPGLSYLDNGNVVNNNLTYVQRPFLPLFDGLDLKKYRWNGYRAVHERTRNTIEENADVFMLPVQNLSGCVNRCAFCGESETRCAGISPTEAVDNLEYLAQKYRTKFFFFMDNEINFSTKFLVAFCSEILKRNLDIFWTACATVKGLDSEELFTLMRRAGACRLVYGLETGSQRMLDYINKGVTLAQAERCLRWSSAAGIWTDLELISGMPFETDTDVALTIRFLEKNRNYIDTAWLNRFFLCLDSSMFNRPKQFGIKNINRLPVGVGANPIKDRRYYYSFDEIDGLGWDEKRKQIESAYSRIKTYLERNGLATSYDTSEMNILLLFLYSCRFDKKQIAEHVRKHRYRKKLKAVIRNSVLQLYKVVKYAPPWVAT